MSVTPRRDFPRDASVRHYVRQWREFRGFTQQGLAERIDVTPSAIAQLERGEVSYVQRTLEKIAEALTCDPADLISGPPGEAQSMWALWTSAGPDERKKIVEIARVIVGRAVADST